MTYDVDVERDDGYGRAEYVIHAKLKNNLLLSRILEQYRNVAQFCCAHDLEQSVVGELVNMKRAAVTKDTGDGARWTKTARAIADALCVEPEELFSEEQRLLRLKTNQAFVEMTRAQALAALDNGMERLLEGRDMAAKIIEAARLTTRERKVIALRFESDMTLDEIGRVFGVTRDRIRQVEARALRKMRQVANDVRDNKRLAA